MVRGLEKIAGFSFAWDLAAEARIAEFGGYFGEGWVGRTAQENEEKMSSQGTQDPQPKPTGGPKGRPMDDAPMGMWVMIWAGGKWIISSYDPRHWIGDEPKCWLPLAEALALLPPPVLP